MEEDAVEVDSDAVVDVDASVVEVSVCVVATPWVVVCCCVGVVVVDV